MSKSLELILIPFFHCVIFRVTHHLALLFVYDLFYLHSRIERIIHDKLLAGPVNIHGADWRAAK
jgi:hypothetical protein